MKKNWKPLSLSVSEEFWTQFDIFCKESAIKKNQFAQIAITQAMEKHRNIMNNMKSDSLYKHSN